MEIAGREWEEEKYNEESRKERSSRKIEIEGGESN
jgi:hypothetical protein